MFPIRTLIVDDSALMRRMLTMSLERDDRIAVVGAVASAKEARDAVRQLNPDVLTLDLEMPGMDGATFLGKLMAARPMPVIVISSLAQHTSVLGVKLLELGAFDVVAKPAGGKGAGLYEFADDLCARVLAAAKAGAVIRAKARSKTGGAKPTSAAMASAPAPDGLRLIAVGASTGGVPAVQALLGAMGPSAPPIAIAQHMPDHFTARFAKSLTASTALEVREAQNGLRLSPGMVAIAPGDANLTVESVSGTPKCRLTSAVDAAGATPSVDVLFSSVAANFGESAAAALLTGMGRDGAQGLSEIHAAGGFTAAQDEASCVVFGMPRAAIALGAAQIVGPPTKIAHELMNPINYSKADVA